MASPNTEPASSNTSAQSGDADRLRQRQAYLREQRQADEGYELRERRTAFAAEVGAALSKNHSLPNSLQRCAEAMTIHLDAAFARVWTLNADENVLELQASAGMYTHLDGPHSRVPVGKFKIGLIAEEREPHLTNAVIGDPRVGDQAWAAREGMVGFAGYPLIVADQVVGVMAMFSRQPIIEDTLNALAMVADTLAQVIQRKRAEQALRASEEMNRTMLQSIGDAVIATDTEGRIRFINPVAEELTGWKQSEAISRASKEVFHIVNETTRQAVESPLIRAIEAGAIVGLANHTILIAKDGTERAIEDSGAPIRDDSGRITGAVLVFRDVSARRKSEAQIEALNVRLRRAMTETHHRVKNNLQFISALIEMKRDSGEESVPMSELTRLGQNVRALGIIHDVLTYEAKADGDQQTLSIKKALDTLFATLQMTTGDGRGLRYEFEEIELPSRVVTSAALVANELVLNAMKHGRGEIAVSFCVREGRGILEVLDDGPGFPADFNPEKAANTGLELIESIARWDMTGETEYGNRAEGGARILISFPIAS